MSLSSCSRMWRWKTYFCGPVTPGGRPYGEGPLVATHGFADSVVEAAPAVLASWAKRPFILSILQRIVTTTDAVLARPAASPARASWSRARRRMFAAFVVPAVGILVVVTVLPLLYLVVTSFTPLDLTDPASRRWRTIGSSPAMSASGTPCGSRASSRSGRCRFSSSSGLPSRSSSPAGHRRLMHRITVEGVPLGDA